MKLWGPKNPRSISYDSRNFCLESKPLEFFLTLKPWEKRGIKKVIVLTKEVARRFVEVKHHRVYITIHCATVKSMHLPIQTSAPKAEKEKNPF